MCPFLLEDTATYTATLCNTLQLAEDTLLEWVPLHHTLCCRVLQCDAAELTCRVPFPSSGHCNVHCDTLQHSTTYVYYFRHRRCVILQQCAQCDAVPTMSHTATLYNTPQHTATLYNPTHSATLCNTLQPTPTMCPTLLQKPQKNLKAHLYIWMQIFTFDYRFCTFESRFFTKSAFTRKNLQIHLYPNVQERFLYEIYDF